MPLPRVRRCKQCVWQAPATFRIEPEHGRSRVYAQWCVVPAAPPVDLLDLDLNQKWARRPVRLWSLSWPCRGVRVVQLVHKCTTRDSCSAHEQY